MTLTNNCSSLTICSDLLLGQISYGVEISLNGTSILSVTLDNTELGTVDSCGVFTKGGTDPTCIDIASTLLGGTATKLKDGVYTVKVTITNPDTTTSSETNCIFSDCCLICQIIKEVANNPTSLIAQKYNLLKYHRIECDCICDDMVTLYNSLVSDLNNTNNNCGC